MTGPILAVVAVAAVIAAALVFSRPSPRKSRDPGWEASGAGREILAQGIDAGVR